MLYHTAITVAFSPSTSSLPLDTNRNSGVHLPSITHHSPVWLSLDIIVPFVAARILAWSDNSLDHHVFESTLMSQCIAQATSTDSTVHMLSLPRLLSHLQAATTVCQSSVTFLLSNQSLVDPPWSISSKSGLVNIVNTVDPLLYIRSKSSLINVVTTVNPLLTVRSKPSLVVNTVDPLSIFRSKSHLVVNSVDPLSTFSSKPSLVVNTVDPLSTFRSKSSLVVKPVDPLLTFSSKPGLVVNTVDLLSTFSSKSSLVVNTVDPLSIPLVRSHV